MHKMVKQSQIARGEKWTKVRAQAEFENRADDVKWMDKQKAIVTDIEIYEDSIKPKVAKVEPKKVK